MDPWSTINPKGDSTYSIALEAQKRGHKLFYYSPNNLSLENNKVNAKGNFFTLSSNKTKFFSLKKIKKMNLNLMDVVLVRQDPPFNMNYITATYLLEKLSDKVLVINNPKHIRDYPEKLSMFDFDKIIPPTLVSGDLQEILQFNKKNKISIIGPRHGEKIHESLCSSEEMSKAINLKKYFRIPADLRNINYDIHNKKNDIFKHKESYNSKNTQRLNEKELIKLLQKQKEISKEKSYKS